MKRKPRAEPHPSGNPGSPCAAPRSQTGLPHRDVEQPCFFLPERAMRPTKKPRRACGTLRGEAAACGPAASGDSDQQEILGSNFLGDYKGM